MTADFISCSIRRLPPELAIEAAATAHRINPANRPAGVDEPMRIAMTTSKYWGAGGVKLSVGFMEQTATALANKIIAAANLWAKTANVTFVLSSLANAQVRISRGPGGYFSYLGTDILHIPASQETMNLERFSLNTPDSEYLRVVCHEFGHTLGCPHEHMRKDIVSRLDPAKTIAYFEADQGWSATEIQQQVLTPLDERSLMSTPVDVTSIMCYQLPGSITTDGQPIPGGAQIDTSDAAFMATMYPLAVAPPTPPVPPPPPVNPPVQPPPTPPAGTTIVTVTGSNLSVSTSGSPVAPSTSGDFMSNVNSIIASIGSLDWSQIVQVIQVIETVPPGTVGPLISLAVANKIPGAAIVATLWAHKDQLTADLAAVEKAFGDVTALLNPPTPVVPTAGS